MAYNNVSLDKICGSLSYAMGIDAPVLSESPDCAINELIDTKLNGKKADRIFIYNPDAIAQWIYEKYQDFFTDVKKLTDIELPLCSVMPSVTPVCFATMYTGTQPETHGIRKYEKPVLKTDSIFDALIRAGKKPAIVAESKSSMAMIYLEKDMDYYIYDTIEEVNSKAKELILEDKYDFIAVYNGDYDSAMHKYGPEGKIPVEKLKLNCEAFIEFAELIKENWKNHNTLIGFAMDHGCHEIDGECGSHGLDMEEDLNIVHLYGVYTAE